MWERGRCGKEGRQQDARGKEKEIVALKGKRRKRRERERKEETVFGVKTERREIETSRIGMGEREGRKKQRLVQ